MNGTRRRLITAALLACTAVAGCGRGTAPSRATPIPLRGGELVASIRAEPRSFNRLVARDQTTELITLLTQAPLVRINRQTFALEPWLADHWTSSQDGLTYTLHLRPGVRWSDGEPLTSADVTFSLDAVFDPRTGSLLADVLTVGGQRIRATAPDPRTVVLHFAAPSGQGLRLLDNLPVLPRHRLASALEQGRLASAWPTRTPPAELAGAGPFVVSRYDPGQQVVLERNPHYWRRGEDGAPLPYLDRLVLQVVPSQDAEILRLTSGQIDISDGEVRPEDWVGTARAQQAGAIRIAQLGVGTDADAFWFCLNAARKKDDPRFAFAQRPEFRQALSSAVDRAAFVDAVYLGKGVPLWGPITPGNTRWFSPAVRQYPFDLSRARRLLTSIGLEDRNGNGVVEDAAGTEARFTVITQGGVASYQKGTALLREQAARIGVALDIVPLDFSAMIARMLASDYDAIYMRPLATDLDPAGNLDVWLSSGSGHFWNLGPGAAATNWERRIDTLMLEQARELDPAKRRALFDAVQEILSEQLPVLYFAAPQIYQAYSSRLEGATPSVLRPHLLWNADSLRARSRD